MKFAGSVLSPHQRVGSCGQTKAMQAAAGPAVLYLAGLWQLKIATWDLLQASDIACILPCFFYQMLNIIPGSSSLKLPCVHPVLMCRRNMTILGA